MTIDDAFEHDIALDEHYDHMMETEYIPSTFDPAELLAKQPHYTDEVFGPGHLAMQEEERQRMIEREDGFYGSLSNPNKSQYQTITNTLNTAANTAVTTAVQTAYSLTTHAQTALQKGRASVTAFAQQMLDDARADITEAIAIARYKINVAHHRFQEHLIRRARTNGFIRERVQMNPYELENTLDQHRQYLAKQKALYQEAASTTTLPTPERIRAPHAYTLTTERCYR